VKKVIETGVYGIKVTVYEDGVCGQIVSELHDCADDSSVEYNAAIDGLESLILAHACAGIDIASPAYLEGIEAAVEAIANNVDDTIALP
jgi:hypothetical protein